MSKPKKINGNKKSWLRSYINSFNYGGTVVGLIFVFFSFWPSLLPRGWFLQGVVSGVLFSIGYGLGVVISDIVRRFRPKEPSPQLKNKIKVYSLIVLLVAYVVGLFLGLHWQQQTDKLVGQSPENSLSVISITLVAVLIVMFLLLISRSIRTLYHWLRKIINRFLPKPLAYLLGLIITVVIVVGFINGFLLSGIMEVVNQAFSVRNGSTDAGIVQPTAPELSGSSHSLIPWDTLGRQGRNFVGRGETPAQLNSFSHTQAMQPIRIYSGLESADSTQKRAQLAVSDLKRAGGFNRKIIVVATTTGTGWVDEQGVEPVEYMYNGDSAIVSMQYSYLPSWLSFLVDQTKAKEAGNDLYNAVYNESLNLPAAQRPKIVVFGESLGSFGSENAFANEATFRATSSGAVWVGPPNFNTLWRQFTQSRDVGSPEILPVYQQGQTVRWANRPKDFNNPAKDWRNPKIAYLQNPSDPIVWWSPKLLFEKPDWLSEPRGADVSPSTLWLPIISFWQVSGDMVFSTGVPDGHGHKYGNLPTDAWSYVAPPDGWNQQKTEALKTKLGG